MQAGVEFSSLNLEQLLKNELSGSHTIKISTQSKTTNVSKRWCRIKQVYGKLELVAAPHYSLTLSSPSCERKFSLVLVDSAKNVNQWISAIGLNVKISDLFVISEQFQMRGNDPIDYLSLMVKWENVSVIHSDLPMQNTQLSQNGKSHQSPDPLSNLFRIYVYHVSAPFYVKGRNQAYCLVFISYFNVACVQSKLWLVLTKEQVAWRDFILPNREYRIKFPPNNKDIHYFDKHKTSLDNIFPPETNTLKEIFHHRDFFLSLKACLLPENSKLYLSSKMNAVNGIHAIFKDPMSLWFSVSEASRADADLVSLYGQIDETLYTEETTFGSGACQLCNRGQRQEPALKEPRRQENLPWVNPWHTKSLPEFPLLELPIVCDDMTTMETGVAGGMVQVVKIRDTVTGDQISVYMKHLTQRSSQRACRLLPGLVVCFTQLNRRLSGSGRYYYMPTALTSLRVLALPEATSGSEMSSESWGRYGLWHQSLQPSEKMWGVLESFHLSKITISAKCKNCQAVFQKAICSARCPNPRAYNSSAHAIAKIQVISDQRSISIEKVLIKDGCVRKLLNMPADIWEATLVAASMEEIVVFFDSATDEKFQIGLNGLFKIYCTITHLPNKMYICLVKLGSKDGEDPLYYCLQIEPINNSRLSQVAQLARQATNS